MRVSDATGFRSVFTKSSGSCASSSPSGSTAKPAACSSTPRNREPQPPPHQIRALSLRRFVDPHDVDDTALNSNFWTDEDFEEIDEEIDQEEQALAESCRPSLKGHAHSCRDHVALPIVEIARIVGVLIELEVAGFVGSLGIPLAKGVAHISAQGVAMVEVGMGQYDEQSGRGGAEAGCEFRPALDMHEGALVRSEFVFENDWGFDQFHVVANQNLVIHSGDGEIDLAHLSVDGDGEIAVHREDQTAEDGELLGMIGVVGGYADFASRDDARTTVLDRRFFHHHVAVEIEVSTGDRGQRAEFVGSLADVEVDSPALTIARDGSR